MGRDSRDAEASAEYRKTKTLASIKYTEVNLNVAIDSKALNYLKGTEG